MLDKDGIKKLEELRSYLEKIDQRIALLDANICADLFEIKVNFLRGQNLLNNIIDTNRSNPLGQTPEKQDPSLEELQIVFPESYRSDDPRLN